MVYTVPNIGIAPSVRPGGQGASNKFPDTDFIVANALLVGYDIFSDTNRSNYYFYGNTDDIRIAFYKEDNYYVSVGVSSCGTLTYQYNPTDSSYRGNSSNISKYSEHNGIYYYRLYAGSSLGVESYYNTIDEALAAIGLGNSYPITYRLTNCTAPTAPIEAAVGDTVNVPFIFPEGYGFPSPATDVYVYNNGVLVPSSYVNNVLTFTMPDPS